MGDGVTIFLIIYALQRVSANKILQSTWKLLRPFFVIS